MTCPFCDVATLDLAWLDAEAPLAAASPGEAAAVANFIRHTAGIVPSQGPSSTFRDLHAYLLARLQASELNEDFHTLFQRFLTAGSRGRSLLLQCGSTQNVNFDPHWLSLDLRQVEQRARESGAVFVDLEDESMDAVFCGNLGRICKPENLVSELRRVLRQSGEIWIQTPLTAPYLAESNELDVDYWRITPDGLRLMMASFDEILCSAYLPDTSALSNYSFFYGLKPSHVL